MIPTNETKICKRCGEEKPLVAFHHDARTKDGFRGVCKDCINASLRAARWRKAHPVELVRVEPPKELWGALKEHNHHEPEPAPAQMSPIERIVAAIRRRLGL